MSINEKPVNDTSLMICLSIMITVAQLAIAIYLPSLPVIARNLHISLSSVQNSLYLFLMAYGFSQLFYGPLSDSYGRKKILLLGLIIFIIGDGLIIFSNNLSEILIARMIQGFGAGAISVLTRAILCDRFSDIALRVALSILVMFTNITPAIAPFIGGHLDSLFGWRANFIFLLFYSLAILILLLFFMPETKIVNEKVKVQAIDTIKNYWQILTSKVFAANIIGIVMIFSCQILYLSVLPIIFQNNFHLTSVACGNWMMFPALAYGLGNLCNSKLVKFFQSHYLVLFGLGLIISSAFLLIFLGHSVILITVLVSFIVFAIGLVFPNLTVNAIEPFTTTAGTAAALLGFIQMLGSSLMNSLGGYFQMHTPQSLVVAIFIFSIITNIAFLIWNTSFHKE